MRWSLLALFVVGSLSAAEKRNVVLIVLDDAGQRDFGCCGSTYHKTPHIDSLAKESVKFTEATSACPVCSPSRAALMTGKYPQRFGITDWLPGQPDRPTMALARPKLPAGLPLEAVTLAEALRAAGYDTAHIGKWHLGGAGFEPTRQGFDVNIGGDHRGHPPSYFAPYEKKQPPLPGLEKAEPGEYLTDRLTAEAVAWMRKERTKPFFLHLAHYAPHTPLQAKPELQKAFAAGKPGSQGNPAYAAMLASIDESIRDLRKALVEAKQWESTIVVFTSDNGGLATLEGLPAAPTYNGPFREGKGYLYEGGLRVPLLIRGPGISTFSTVAGPVNGIDVMPTILDLCGVAGPKDLDGVTLKPLMTGGALPPRDLFWHYPHYANQGGKPGGAIRSGEYKLIEFYEPHYELEPRLRRELFHVAKDVSESRNLAEEKPNMVAELAAKLAAWRTNVNAVMPTGNPNHLPNPQAADGSIAMHARTAKVFGTQLRFEPLPHKNTLGFWTNAKDYAEFECTVTTGGPFEVEATYGCGKGSGGAEVEIVAGKEGFRFIVEDTGGFQAFVVRKLGSLTLPEGRRKLRVQALTKPGVAVMDLQQLRLKPAK